MRQPEEACGLLSGEITAGLTYFAKEIYEMTNMLHSPVRYRLDPAEQIAVFERMDAQGQDLVGIYHSHPHGPPHPSPTDIAEATYPETVYIIWSPSAGRWSCRAFLIRDHKVSEVEIRS